MHYSAHMASHYMGTLPRKVHPENAKLKYSEISTLQNRQINMQLKYSFLQYLFLKSHLEVAYLWVTSYYM